MHSFFSKSKHFIEDIDKFHQGHVCPCLKQMLFCFIVRLYILKSQ